MWYLKVKYKHSDCIYAPKLEELNVSVFFYYLGRYVRGNYVYTSAIQHLIGFEKSVKKYIQYMKNHRKIMEMDVYGDVIFTLAKHRKELKVYEVIYDPIFIYPSPAYLSKDGFEIIEVACWRRKPLQKLIRSLEKNKTTEHFEVLKFFQKDLNDIYVTRLLPKCAKKQEDAIKLAFSKGYYKFPRKTNLDELARIAKVTKPTNIQRES